MFSIKTSILFITSLTSIPYSLAISLGFLYPTMVIPLDTQTKIRKGNSYAILLFFIMTNVPALGLPKYITKVGSKLNPTFFALLE